MTALVVGASGATGRLLVGQLLEMGETVRALVRSADRLPRELVEDERVDICVGTILDLSDGDLRELVSDCAAVASCLGHNLSFRGVFGPPWRLVTTAVRRLCQAVQSGQPERPVRFVLMNTTGVRNRDLDEPISLAQHVVIGLLRLLLPPHADNERAAELLRTEVGRDDAFVEWVAVRPDGLVDADAVSPYTLHPSPTRSAIFDAGTTSRINVANLMARLMTDSDLWHEWRWRIPVVYNAESE